MLDKKIFYFIKVVQNGSFSSAARELYLSQPALSKQITLLEDELKIQLFDRNGYRPVLTPAGESYYKAVCDLKNDYDQMIEQLRHMDARTIKIGFTGAFENREIIKTIGKIKKKHDQLAISFLKYNFDESVRALLEGEIDLSLGIESTFQYHDSIAYEILYQYDICLICSFDHPFAQKSQIDIQQVKNQNMILLSKNFGKDFYRDFMEACRLDGFKPKIKKMVDTLDELIFQVSIGEGVAIVSKDVVHETEVKVLDLLHSHHSSNYVLAYRKKGQDDLIRSFIQEIKEAFPNSIT